MGESVVLEPTNHGHFRVFDNTVGVPKDVERFYEDKKDSDFSSYMCAYDQNLGKLYLRVFNHIDTMEFSLENVKEDELVTYSVK